MSTAVHADRPPTRVRAGRLAPGAVVLVTALAALVATHTPLLAALAFLAGVLWLVVLPGVVVHRLLRGRPRTIVEDLGWGSATGLVVQVVVGLVTTALGIPLAQAAAPLVILVAALAIPRVRALLTLGPYADLVPASAAWTGALTAVWATAMTAWRGWSQWGLTPGPLRWPSDLFWYLGFVAELKRSVPPQIVQVHEGTFAYHWFSILWMSGTSLVTGVPAELIVVRLWIVPMIWMTVLTTMALGLHLTRRAMVGAGAALMLVAGTQVMTSSWFGLYGLDPWVITSPSHLYGIVVMLALMAPLVDVMRGRPIGRGWVLLLLLAAACGGSKSSIVPTLLCGVLLVGALHLLRRRPLRGPLLALGVMVVGFVAALPLSGGGSAGTSVQLFSTVFVSTPWERAGRILPPGQFYQLVPDDLHRPGAPLLLVLILLTYLLRVVWLGAALPALRLDDPAPAFLLGIGLAGVGALLLIAQDGFSQIYFLRGGIVAWTLLACWGTDLVWQQARQVAPRLRTVSAWAGGAVGILVVAVAQAVSTGSRGGQVSHSLLRAAVVILAAVAAAVVSILATRRSEQGALVRLLWCGAALAGTVVPCVWAAWQRGAPSAGVLPLVAAAVLCAVVAGLGLVRPARRLAVVPLLALTVGVGVAGVVRVPSFAGPRTGLVQPDELGAARWVDEHVPQDDLLATNVHCYGEFRTRPHCDARGFWVSGFTGRRVLVDGWAYTVRGHEAQGVGNLHSKYQPFYDRALFALNEGAFTDPTPEGLAALRSRGVRWLYADARASRVSPRLAELADVVHRQGPVTIYRLR